MKMAARVDYEVTSNCYYSVRWQEQVQSPFLNLAGFPPQKFLEAQDVIRSGYLPLQAGIATDIWSIAFASTACSQVG